MKVSKCHLAKMIRHSISWIKICSECWYASEIINITKNIKKQNPKKLF